MKKTTPFFFSAALLLLNVSLSGAEVTPKAGTVTLVIGNATVERGTPTEVKPVHFRDPVYLKDSIATEEESFVRVLMGRKALVTVSEMSVLTITEDLHQATINLDSGFIGLSVARKRMENGEYIEIRTPHAVAAVRGTKVIAEVPKPDFTRITVVEGHVDVYSHSRPDKILSVRTSQSVEARLTAPSRIKTLTPKGLEKKKQKLTPPKEPVENSSALDRIVKKQIGEASQIARALTSEEMGENLGGNPGTVAGANNSGPDTDSEIFDNSSTNNSSDSGKTGEVATESTNTASLSNTSQGSGQTPQIASEASHAAVAPTKGATDSSKATASQSKGSKTKAVKSKSSSKPKGTVSKSKSGSKPKVKKASNKSKGGSKPKVKKASKPKMKKASKPKMKKASKPKMKKASKPKMKKVFKPKVKKVSKPKSFAKKSKKNRKRKK